MTASANGMPHQRSNPRLSCRHDIRCLWLAVSGHGHGHLVQVTPLVRALQARYPSLRVIVQSVLPLALLQEMFGKDIRVHAQAADFGMMMDGPLTVLPEQSHAAYQAFHAEWDARLAGQVARYEEAQPDLVIADIAYLPLAAARVRGTPALAVCSLNWADIHEHYCAHLPGATELSARIREHYAAADRFLKPVPAMPMPTLGNTRNIGPLVALGKHRRDLLIEQLQLANDCRVVLVTLGGIAGRVDITRWPRFDNTLFLVPAAWLSVRQGARRGETLTQLPPLLHGFASIESTSLTLAELFASCDAVVTKPGYGAFAAAGCVGVPVLYAERGDWPEEPYLSAWLHSVGRAVKISRYSLEHGSFGPVLNELLAQPVKPPAPATGASDALAIIDQLLDERAGTTLLRR